MALDSNGVVRKFSARMQKGIGLHRELLLAVHLKTHQAALETMLVEQFVLNAAVLWEVFLSDLLLAYLVASPTRFLKSLRLRVLQSIEQRFGPRTERLVSIDTPRSLSLSSAAGLADPKNYNLTVNSSEHLKKRANEMLAAQYAKHFTLPIEDSQFLDFVVALRNFLGHRSPASLERLKKATGSLDGKNAALNAKVSNIGTYLKARSAPSNDPRSIAIALRLVEVSESLK